MSDRVRNRAGPRRVRMEEVAKAAGVSAASVSRALREPETVSQDLLGRVRDAAERLGYAPNRIAGSLAGAKTPLVGVIVPSLTNSFFAGTLERMTSALEKEGYQVMIGHHEYDLDREERIVMAFLSWNPSALVVTGIEHTRATTGWLSTTSCPVIEMWDLDGRPLDSVVGFSNEAAGRMAGRRFADAGYRNVGFVGAILDQDPRARIRAHGFGEEFERLSRHKVEIVTVDGRELGQGGEGLRLLLERMPKVEAIAFSGDMLAVGAMLEAQRRGIAIPEDIALLGYGDLDISAHTNPGLSTIRPPRNEIGEAVARHILDRLGDPLRRGEVIDLGISIITRESG